MRNSRLQRPSRHWLLVLDAGVGLAVFIGLACMAGAIGPAGAQSLDPSGAFERKAMELNAMAADRAAPTQPALQPGQSLPERSAIGRPARLPDQRQAFFLVAGVFSLLVAMNFSLLRHLRRTAVRLRAPLPRPVRGDISRLIHDGDDPHLENRP